jgi:ankyrin repeat protein
MLSVAGTTPLVCAVFDGNIEVMKYLLDRGGNPRKKTPGGLTLLHAAAAKGVFSSLCSSVLVQCALCLSLELKGKNSIYFSATRAMRTFETIAIRRKSCGYYA